MRPKIIPSAKFSRRTFLRGSLLTTGALTLGGCATFAPPRPRVRLPGEKLNLAGIGCGGKGSSDIKEMMDAGVRVIALCDVDETMLLKKASEVRASNNPGVRLYRDFRVMLEREKDIDAVTVSTPDHMHAPATALAMMLGKHVYTQKPLTHTIWEARRLRDLARKTGVVTQMGNQGSASADLRRGVEVLQAGVIGPIREVHIWTGRPGWPQGVARPTTTDIVPSTLDWNLWLGVAPERPFVDKWPDAAMEKLLSDYNRTKKFPYNSVYHPFNWRGWHDFGTGALGDMACHLVNLPFRALDLGYATEVEAQVAGTMPETYPQHATVRFQYPQRGTRPPVTLWWYEGGRFPPKELVQDVVDLYAELPESGTYFVGDQGRFVLIHTGAGLLRLNNEPKLRSITKHPACLPIPESLPRVNNHYKEWVDACVAGKPGQPYSRFEIAAYLTEMVLIGCIAQRLPGQKIAWDGPGMRSPNTPAATALVKSSYRPGWTV